MNDIKQRVKQIIVNTPELTKESPALRRIVRERMEQIANEVNEQKEEMYQLSKDQIAYLFNDVIEMYHEHLVRYATSADRSRDIAIENGMMWLDAIVQEENEE